MSFQFKHLIYPVRKECTLILNPVFPVTVNENVEYTVKVGAYSGLRLYGLRGQKGAPTKKDQEFFDKLHPLCVCGDHLEFTMTFPQEDCYRLWLYLDGQQVDMYEVYALEEDLFTKTPFKGDNHMHTCMSDGKETPMYVAACACRTGYDYCVITDHYEYAPSVMTKEFYEPTGVDFLVIPGEEIHSPGNWVHIVGMGGRESVDAWWRKDQSEYDAAVAKEMEKITEPMLDQDRFEAAASQVVFDRVRSVGGISILAHPKWVITKGFAAAEDIIDYLFEHRRFDAVELVAGGAGESGTQMQVSDYLDKEHIPIVGSSDTHGCYNDDLQPHNYTVVFADSLETESIKQAILEGKTIAGDGYKLYGNYRLVKYGYFLRWNYFPEHAHQRRELGAQMQFYASRQPGPESKEGQELKLIRPSERFAALRYQQP